MSTDRPAGEAASAPDEEPTTGTPAARTDADADTATGTDTSTDAATPPGAEGGPGVDPAGADSAVPVSAADPTGRPAASGTPGPDAGGKRSAAAEALAAAVRAVESGERSAASFFTDSPPARQGRDAARGAGGGGARPGGARERTGGPGHEQPRAAGPGGPAPARASTAPGAGQPVRAVAGPAPGPAGDVPGAAEVRRVLAEGGAPESLAGAVVVTLGEAAAEVLREDPWQLLAVPGVRHDQADGFARALLGPGCGPGDERRSQALTVWLLERAALEGHTALESSALRAGLAKLSVPDPDTALRSAIADGLVLVFQDAADTPGPAARPAAGDEDGTDDEQPVRVLLGLDRFALAEESLADGLARLAGTFADRSGDPAAADTGGDGGAGDGSDGGSGDVPGHGEASAAGPGTADWEAAAAAAPTPSAAELIRTAAGHGLVAHSGGETARAEPAALVAAARSLGLRAYAAAHTEDGRRRLAELIDAASPGEGADGLGDADRTGDTVGGGFDAAVTVAGLLSGHEGPGRDEDGALALDLIAVLDAPQLDVEAAAMLVESLPDGARLVLSGDLGALWSAGPGKVFADLLAARRCPQVVSRTPDSGPIGELISGIGIGELNQVEAPGKEVVIVPVRDAGEAVHRTVQLVADSVPRALGVPPEHTQVITPGHGGAAGTRALNAALKERLNPGPGRFGGFDPGDRVAYVPAPGRALPGTVVSADAEGLHLDCAGAAVVVPREQVADTVRHGWALTAHQAVGARWPAAVVVLPGDAAAGLTRAWVYTAFGRGERHLSVVHGAEAALARAVAEIPAKERTTRLRSLLQAQLPSAG
ncbi:helix-hairpin-helix domain-containing protein [Streptomyces sp. ME19-01-6]|uniref:helix-hairpin-helix domain-containing protein n=1 Tax=Streptomyces sp. ME19-01-6 TaxID=3028686 RepID=UPI0029B528E4|nr:helix-hairpin-helix domain-containing protein [Streptomyces sp. ME19-01-6]MDX3229711.1 helix-hairpin-helix domain-containing protein [Streptomyces sp. ME19-01-6]